MKIIAFSFNFTQCPKLDKNWGLYTGIEICQNGNKT